MLWYCCINPKMQKHMYAYQLWSRLYNFLLVDSMFCSISSWNFQIFPKVNADIVVSFITRLLIMSCNSLYMENTKIYWSSIIVCSWYLWLFVVIFLLLNVAGKLYYIFQFVDHIFTFPRMACLWFSSPMLFFFMEISIDKDALIPNSLCRLGGLFLDRVHSLLCKLMNHIR